MAKIVFERDGIHVKEIVDFPIIGHTEVGDKISYDEISEKDNLTLIITRIVPQFDDDAALRSIELTLKDEPTVIQPPKKIKGPKGPQPHKKYTVIIEGIKYPDKIGNGILITAAEYLIERGLLKVEDVPIDVTTGPRHLINDEKRHKNGKEFSQPKQLSNGLYIETHISLKDIKVYSRRLLEKFKVFNFIVQEQNL